MPTKYLRQFAKHFLYTTFFVCGSWVAAVPIPNTPLVTQVTEKPLTLLVSSKDHKLFFEAYNDASDIDGDGALDLRFKPTITYLGIFDSNICYTYYQQDSDTTPSAGGGESNGIFKPGSLTSTGKCTNAWSGNWLNYITTSRYDALKKVLYGGQREIDTATDTILRRTYIPSDGHSWAKEYTSLAVDGYSISDYTTLSAPSTGRRHFFGNATMVDGISCSTPSNCQSLPPKMLVITNSDRRVWQWASSERPVLNNANIGTGVRTDYTVRARVCSSGFTNGCKQYGSNYKPIGLLHDYASSMKFGLLTGSYNKNMSGGVLRKEISDFANEINTNGTFKSTASIVNNLNKVSIRDFNNTNTGSFYRNGSYRTGPMSEGAYVDWGNPLGEMMYEGLRYFSGKSSATSDFSTSGGHDGALGLTTGNWDNPYSTSSAANAQRCAKPNMLMISDVYTSYDGDQVPKGEFTKSGFTSDISTIDTKALLFTISSNESIGGKVFIGQTTTANKDFSPTAKTISDLGTAKGLAPEETTKEGTYSAAAIAYYGKTNDVNSASGNQFIDSYFLTLASTLPTFDTTINGKKITIIPFAKTVDGASTNRAKGQYQPTDQIVDLYITKDDLNGPSGELELRVNFEADEQGNDFEGDVIALYKIKKNTNSVTIDVEVVFEGTGSNQNVGYVISGSDRDGIYLVAQDKNEDLGYFLNVPPNRSAGWCDATPETTAGCKKLPYLTGTPSVSSQTFVPSSSSSAGSFLKNPLWYGAKWGGFKDKNGDNKPTLNAEWDSNNDSVPDNYFLVQNPTKLKEALQKAFDQIAITNSSAANVIANSTSISTDTRVYQARFDSNYWSGDLVAYPVTTSGVSNSTEWEASTKMPLPGSRNIIIRNSDGVARQFSTGAYSSMPTADKTALVDVNVVDYLRGDRSKELSSGGSYRNRAHALGDLVHSSPFYLKESNAVFVGSNGGMLHAFDGTSGVEKFAFIPSQSISRLANLSASAYVHDYYVDGDVVVSPRSSETSNKNLLFATMGRGGKGLFSLDVTNPATFAESNVLWEYTPAANSTAAADNNLGYMIGRPIFAKLNNGLSAVIVGNGVNSVGGKAVLYIFTLNTSGQIAQTISLDTNAGTDNGLFSPGVVDTNGDGTIDAVYAGDIKGNVWKFDLSSATSASWSVAYAGKPLFVATDASGTRQPITAPITVATDTKAGDEKFGKRFVFFGTGSYFRSGDPADTSTQSWYGVIDDGSAFESYLPATGKVYQRDFLKTRTLSSSSTYGGKPVRSFGAIVTGDMVAAKGWVIDFTVETGGERIITESIQYKLKEYALVASSIIPSASDPCVPGGTGYINAVDPWSGALVPGNSIFDVNSDNSFVDDKVNGVAIGSVNLGVGLPSRPILIGSRLVVGGTDPINRVKDVKVNLGAAATKGRIAWREIVRD